MKDDHQSPFQSVMLATRAEELPTSRDSQQGKSAPAWWQRRMALWEDSLASFFECDERQTTVSQELFCGLVQFLSTIYILPVIPSQMALAGYNRDWTINSISLSVCIGSTIFSILSNLPFIIAPPTSVSIYLVVSQLNLGVSRSTANAAVMLSGLVLLLMGVIRPVGRFITKLIPDCIQASTAAGIGLITALAGAVDLKLVVAGKYTVVTMGSITPAVVIAVITTAVVGICLHYHLKGSFIIGMLSGAFLWWTIENSWPTNVLAIPVFEWANVNFSTIDFSVIQLLFNLFFLYVLLLNGLAKGLSDLAHITKANGNIPRGNWIFIVCGLLTVFSGYFSGPPILISPETAAGIKAGAKTGLSTLVCGLMYIIALIFSPLFAAVPACATAPLMFFVGIMLFQNIGRIRWDNQLIAVTAFFVMLLIPFTYSIMCGVGFGYVVYIIMSIFTGDFIINLRRFLESYSIKLPGGSGEEVEEIKNMQQHYQELVDEEEEEEDYDGSVILKRFREQEEGEGEGEGGERRKRELEVYQLTQPQFIYSPSRLESQFTSHLPKKSASQLLFAAPDTIQEEEEEGRGGRGEQQGEEEVEVEEGRARAAEKRRKSGLLGSDPAQLPLLIVSTSEQLSAASPHWIDAYESATPEENDEEMTKKQQKGKTGFEANVYQEKRGEANEQLIDGGEVKEEEEDDEERISRLASNRQRRWTLHPQFTNRRRSTDLILSSEDIFPSDSIRTAGRAAGTVAAAEEEKEAAGGISTQRNRRAVTISAPNSLNADRMRRRTIDSSMNQSYKSMFSEDIEDGSPRGRGNYSTKSSGGISRSSLDGLAAAAAAEAGGGGVGRVGGARRRRSSITRRKFLERVSLDINNDISAMRLGNY